MKIPILVLAFNRADHVAKAMEAIREYKPDRLYLECDGARDHKIGEKDAVELTRKTMLDMVDWPCEVKTLFREENLGCANAVYGAITWFFEHEEWGVIIEDDVVVGQDFFRLCEELLPRYKDEERIQQITSQFYGKHVEYTNKYSFGKKPYIWGWATWRRSWYKYMDMDMKKYPNFSFWKLSKIYGLFQSLMMFYYWSNTYKNLQNCSSWATRWHFAAVSNDLISICPNTNLGINIGCDGEGGTHYSKGSKNPYSWLRLGHLNFPLKHPELVELDMCQVAIDNKDFKRIKFWGAIQKLKNILAPAR